MSADTPEPPSSAADSAAPAAGTPAPGTPAPGTPAPGTPAPGTPAPGTPAPGTPAPGTPAPGTPAPGTSPPVPSSSSAPSSAGTPADSKPAAPVKAAPVKAAAAAQPKPAAAAPPSAAAKPARPAVVRYTRPPGAGASAAAATIAVLSLLVALGGVAIAIHALDVAREAKSAAAPGAVLPNPDPTTPPASVPTASPSPTPAPRPSLLAEIVTAERRLPAAENCNAVYVDVDALQVGVLAGHEFYLSSCLGSPELRVDRKESAAQTVANPRPDDCAALLAGVTSGAELILRAQPGLTFCLLTSRVDASAQGIPQRLAIVEVTGVGADGSLTIEVSTYRVQPTAA